MLDSLQPHAMELETVYATGAEEWLCPTCGRRLVMQWPPAFKRIILVPGDDQTPHHGGKGGLRLSTSAAHAPDRPTEDPWTSWLNSADTAKWWPDDLDHLQ